jgi:hypothetical protein
VTIESVWGRSQDRRAIPPRDEGEGGETYNWRVEAICEEWWRN